MELKVDNEMEVSEKLCCISNDLKVLQDGRAGLVPRVSNFTCKLNFTNFNFAVRPQPWKFVERENIPVLQYHIKRTCQWGPHQREQRALVNILTGQSNQKICFPVSCQKLMLLTEPTHLFNRPTPIPEYGNLIAKFSTNPFSLAWTNLLCLLPASISGSTCMAISIQQDSYLLWVEFKVCCRGTGPDYI